MINLSTEFSLYLYSSYMEQSLIYSNFLNNLKLIFLQRFFGSQFLRLDYFKDWETSGVAGGDGYVALFTLQMVAGWVPEIFSETGNVLI